MLNNNQLKFVELYCKGESINNISKILDISSATLYSYLKKEEIRKEIGERERRVKAKAISKLNNKLEYYIDELEDIARNTENDKTKTDIYIYLINRVLGNPKAQSGAKEEQKAEQRAEEKKAIKEQLKLIKAL